MTPGWVRGPMVLGAAWTQHSGRFHERAHSPQTTGTGPHPGSVDPGDGDRPAGETGTPRDPRQRIARAPRAVGAGVAGPGPSPFRPRPARAAARRGAGDRRRRWAGGSPPPRATDAWRGGGHRPSLRLVAGRRGEHPDHHDSRDEPRWRTIGRMGVSTDGGGCPTSSRSGRSMTRRAPDLPASMLTPAPRMPIPHAWRAGRQLRCSAPSIRSRAR